MKLIVAGGRDYILTPEDWMRLDAIAPSEVVSGGASGADKGGEIWAINAKVTLVRFPADWKKNGKAAGPLRNQKMAEYADAVALFPGGRGTESMRKEAEKAGIVIFDFTGSKS